MLCSPRLHALFLRLLHKFVAIWRAKFAAKFATIFAAKFASFSTATLPPLQPSPQLSSQPSLMSKQLSSQPPSQPPWSCPQNKIYLMDQFNVENTARHHSGPYNNVTSSSLRHFDRCCLACSKLSRCFSTPSSLDRIKQSSLYRLRLDMRT